MRRDASRVAHRSIAWLVIVGALASSCAPPQTVTSVPMRSDKLFEPDTDEVSLWTGAEREEEQIAKTLKFYDDPLLAEYLAKIGDKLASGDAGDAGRPAFTFAVLRDSTLSLFAMPNGRVYVHTGLLARLDNEAQLAMMLGHEMTHVTKRHALRFVRAARDTQVLFPVPTTAVSIGVAAASSIAASDDHVGAAALSPTANLLLGRGLRLAVLAAIRGYGRDLEREADAGGMARLVQAGYDPREAVKVFELLGKESQDRGSLETFFFGNPSRLAECVEDTTQLIQAQYAGAASVPDRVTSTEEFGLRMRAVVRENARLDIQAGRFALAAEQLERVLAVTLNDPIAQLYYGDLYRLQSQRSRDVADKADKERKALERYQHAAELDPSYPDPFRQLGLLYYQQRDNVQAREAFARYLALQPDAPDAPRIRAYLLEIDR
jgi:beta-barrel assembly-enhancing protease